MHRVMLRLAAVTIAAIGIAAMTDAEAADFRLYWDTPTTCVDGSALPLKDIKEYELEAVNQLTLKRTIRFPKVGTNGYLMALESGRYGFRIRANKTDGTKGIWSPQIFGESGVVQVPPLPLCPSTCRCA